MPLITHLGNQQGMRDLDWFRPNRFGVVGNVSIGPQRQIALGGHRARVA
jgi:hypothetical protein